MTESDATCANTEIVDSADEEDSSKADGTLQNNLHTPFQEHLANISAPQEISMSSAAAGESQSRNRCLVLVDDLIQKLQPHPRAEIHRQQVFEYVKKIVERAVQDTSNAAIQAEKQNQLPDTAEVHVCRFG